MNSSFAVFSDVMRRLGIVRDLPMAVVTKQSVTPVWEGGLARVEFVVNIQDGVSVEDVGLGFLYRRPFL